jgi:plastocyanin
MGTRLLLLAICGVVALTIACGDDDHAGDEEVPPADDLVQALEVNAIDFAFEPDEFSARGGELTEVLVTNEGNTEHTFTIDEVDVDETISPGDQVTVTFHGPQKEMTYYCRFHSEMRGVLAIDTAGAPDETDDDEDDGDTPDETDDDEDDDDNSGSGSDSGYYGY